ncbi:MAG: RNA polymerase sigma-70 factor [Candidatus Azobacteroides sp.]|nr:RNA polymerase sigma-70 factor [Candidatus Azobacteroides sp.]
MSFTDIDILTLNRLKQGEAKAFETIFKKYNAKVYNFVLATLYDKNLAEDITQAIFLSIWEHRENIDSQKKFESYLFKISRNMVYRQTEKMLLAYRYEEYVKMNVSGEDSSMEENLEANSLEDFIMELINKLPDARRKIFLLSLKKELSNKEIAEQLSISEKTVETQIRRSLEYLRKKLKTHITMMYFLYL